MLGRIFVTAVLGAGIFGFEVVAFVAILIQAHSHAHALVQYHVYAVAAGLRPVSGDADLLRQILAGLVFIGIKLHGHLLGFGRLGRRFGLGDIRAQAAGERVEVVIFELS